MSVVVIARFPSDDPGNAVKWARAHSDIPEEITAHGKTLGQIGHRILLGEKELVVIDEWPSEESFQTFFSGPHGCRSSSPGLGCLLTQRFPYSKR